MSRFERGIERVRSARHGLIFRKGEEAIPSRPENPKSRLRDTGRVALVGSFVGENGEIDERAVRSAQRLMKEQEVVTGHDSVVGVRVLAPDVDSELKALKETRIAVARSLQELGACVLQYEDPVLITHDGSTSTSVDDGYRSLDQALQDFIADTPTVLSSERAMVVVVGLEDAAELSQRVIPDGICQSKVVQQITPEDMTGGGIATFERVGSNLRESVWESHQPGVQA